MCQDPTSAFPTVNKQQAIKVPSTSPEQTLGALAYVERLLKLRFTEPSERNGHRAAALDGRHDLQSPKLTVFTGTFPLLHCVLEGRTNLPSGIRVQRQRGVRCIQMRVTATSWCA